MTTNGVISNSADYLNTWADEYARGLGHLCMWNPQLWNIYYPFMKKNADAAWNSRRTDLNIAWNGWSQPTPINAAAKPTVHVSAMAMQQFTPTIQSIPGTIEAEDYNFMSGATIEDITAGGKSAGSINTGDWLEYLIDVPSSGIYTIAFTVAGATAGSFEFQQNNITLTTINVPVTGDLQNYTNVISAVKLKAGIHSFKLKAISGGWNIDKFVAQSCQLIVPSLSVNGSPSQNVTSVIVNAGDNVSFSPQPSSGTWSWTGPNGFSANTRTISINGITMNQGGIYTAKYIDPLGCISQQDFTVSLNGCSPTAIVSNIIINNGAPQQINSIILEAGGYLIIDPQPESGLWTWTGPNYYFRFVWANAFE